MCAPPLGSACDARRAFGRRGASAEVIPQNGAQQLRIAKKSPQSDVESTNHFLPKAFCGWKYLVRN